MWSQVLTVTDATVAVNYGLNKVRFPAPVPVGRRIRLRGSVADVTEVTGNGVELVVDLAMEVEGSDKPACVAQAVYRHYA
jgi:acyl dehydratase